MAVPRFLPSWLGGEADRIDGHGVPLRASSQDALPDRPERIEEPLPEELERLLRDPEIVVAEDRVVHELLRAHVRKNPDAAITRAMYLNLWALFDLEAAKDET
jgi:hypothetical protein